MAEALVDAADASYAAVSALDPALGAYDNFQINERLSQARVCQDVIIVCCYGPLKRLAGLIVCAVAQGGGPNLIPSLCFCRRNMRRWP